MGKIIREVRRSQRMGLADMRDASLRRPLHAVRSCFDGRSSNARHRKKLFVRLFISVAALWNVGLHPEPYYGHGVLRVDSAAIHRISLLPENGFSSARRD